MYVYVCMYVRIRLDEQHKYINISLFVYTPYCRDRYSSIGVCIYIYIYKREICLYNYVCIYKCTYIEICICTACCIVNRIYIYTYHVPHIYMFMYVCMYVCMYVRIRLDEQHKYIHVSLYIYTPYCLLFLACVHDMG